MNNLQKLNMTEGSIRSHLIKFSIPIFIGNLLQAAYNVVDSIWIGQFLGAEALAAVTVSFPILFVLISLIIGLTMGATILISQYFGAEEYESLKKTIQTTLAFVGICGIAVSIVGILFSESILKFINTPENIIPMAVDYLIVFSAGLLFMFGYNALGAILRGLGDSKTPLLFLIYATVLNVILDPLFIFGIGPFPKMGVSGAALATTIAQGISFVLGIRHLDKMDHIFKFRFTEIKIDYDILKKSIKIGLPTGIQQTVVSLAAVAITSIVNIFGPITVAAFGAAMRFDNFAFMPAMAIGIGVSTLAGQNIGAGREDRVKETAKWGCILSSAVTVLITMIVLVSPEILMRLFTRDGEVIRIGAEYLRIVSWGYVPIALMFALNGILRGAGDTLASMLITICTLWIIRIPLAKLLSGTSLGARGIWFAMLASLCMNALISYVYYRTGRWKNKAVTGNRMNMMK
ncbi:MATE family efflux transporter [Thermotalea metallivorans]|uniref:Probable multidrug resistance protein NorM n=1 Tax=Thermotalea metallivorans TaxID=520762 RepID=A0A140L175_9FIRM|nr:MATE family efflux transporter [Thermotalea metallivorans]KXG74300.1 Multidrug resistance protein NorM [Thermotalea metallivorans]